MSATSWYNEEELKNLGLKSYGNNVRISRKSSIYSSEIISIGSNVRIDDFCILSGRFEIGNFVHISAACCLFAGDAGIYLEDFTALSSRSAIYAVTDDYSGEFLTNPTIDDEYKHIITQKVVIGKHSVIGTGTTILPGVNVGEGCSFGAMCLINKSTDPWGIYVGIPAKRIKDRSRELLKYEEVLQNSLQRQLV